MLPFHALAPTGHPKGEDAGPPVGLAILHGGKKDSLCLGGCFRRAEKESKRCKKRGQVKLRELGRKHIPLGKLKKKSSTDSTRNESPET